MNIEKFSDNIDIEKIGINEVQTLGLLLKNKAEHLINFDKDNITKTDLFTILQTTWHGIEKAKLNTELALEGIKSERNKLETLSDLAKLAFMETSMQFAVSKRFEILKNQNLLEPGLFIIAGQSSNGKTSLVTDIALDILSHNDDVCFLFFSIDDNDKDCARRMYSQLTSVNLMHCKKITQDATKEGNLSELDYEKYKSITDRIITLELFSSGFTEDIAYEVLEKYKGRCSKIIIALDYLQIIANTGGNDTRQHINRVSNDIKQIQKNLDCLFFLVSQVARNDYNHKLMSSRESSEIDNLANVYINVHQPNTYSKERELHVVKNKKGKRGYYLKYNLDKNFRYEYIGGSEPEDSESENPYKGTGILPPINKKNRVK